MLLNLVLGYLISQIAKLKPPAKFPVIRYLVHTQHYSSQKPRQPIVQKLAAEVWNRLPQDVKNEGEVRREHIDQIGIVQIASGVLT